MTRHPYLVRLLKAAWVRYYLDDHAAENDARRLAVEYGSFIFAVDRLTPEQAAERGVPSAVEAKP